jgi:hypothetical protein
MRFGAVAENPVEWVVKRNATVTDVERRKRAVSRGFSTRPGEDSNLSPSVP